MRILILSNIYPPGFMGGYELGAADVAAGLIRRGHNVDVMTSSFLYDDSGNDVGSRDRPSITRTLECADPNRSLQEVADRIWLGAYALPRNLRELAGRLQMQQPDAVLCFNLAGLGAPSLLRLLVASGMRPVVFLMDHIFTGMCMDASRRRGFERVFSTADWLDGTQFLFMSENLRDEIEAALGRAVPNGLIVPGWFDRAAVAAVEQRDAVGARFVFASRMAGHKGVDIVLEACRRLRCDGCDDFALDLYGAGDVAVTLQGITAMRLQNHVRYLGAPQKAQLMPRLAGYDALLFPTWSREPFGFIVAEAAAAGCIPVMTAGIGASEWFLDGADSIKIERDPTSLHAAMKTIIAMKPAERTAMRHRAQQVAQRFLGFERALDRIEGPLLEAARSPTRAPRVMEAALAALTEIWRARPHG